MPDNNYIISFSDFRSIYNKPQHFSNYLLVFILIATSGIRFFTFELFWVIGLLYVGFIYLRRNIAFPFYKKIYIYLIAFSFIILGQVIKYSFFPAISIGGFYVKTFYVYFAFFLLGPLIIYYYIKTIYFLSLVSFVFYFLIIVLPGFEDYMITTISPYFQMPWHSDEIYSGIPNVILYTFRGAAQYEGYLPRNSGPFWEPGAFACFLSIALLFNFLIERKKITKINFVLFLALITTFSTAGYIAGFVYLLLINFSERKFFYTLFIIPLIGLISFQSFYKLEFLNTKIFYQIEKIDYSNIEYGQRTRFGSALVDFNDFKKNWIVGKGKNEQTRYSKLERSNINLQHRNNGITNFLVKWGLFGFLLFFFWIFKSFKALSKLYNVSIHYSIFSMIIILILGFSQGLFSRPFFIGLAFLHIIPKSFFLLLEKLKHNKI